MWEFDGPRQPRWPEDFGDWSLDGLNPLLYNVHDFDPNLVNMILLGLLILLTVRVLYICFSKTSPKGQKHFWDYVVQPVINLITYVYEKVSMCACCLFECFNIQGVLDALYISAFCNALCEWWSESVVGCLGDCATPWCKRNFLRCKENIIYCFEHFWWLLTEQPILSWHGQPKAEDGMHFVGDTPEDEEE